MRSMDIRKLQDTINNYNYWDMRVLKIESLYFADEVLLVFDDTNNYEIVVRFLGCNTVSFVHVPKYMKTVKSKDLSISQIPYFLQDISFDKTKVEDMEFISCHINMFPLELDLLCKEIEFSRQKSRQDKLFTLKQ